MATMAKRKPKAPKPVDPKWAGKFSALQTKLGLSPDEMAAKFGVATRTYLSWKYGERNPSPTVAALFDLLAKA